ncbi:MAG TPA: choice-of-anchor X domain-containing protein [Thermoanaerobaculia bacterium]|nr:choice-of-anchor X domain-containing protein [Thermoanaerobaculia bacterium]
MLLFFFASVLSPGPSWGGNGIYFHRTDGAPDELTLRVDLLAQGDELANWTPMFKAASRLLFDATEKQVKIAKVIFYKNCAGDQADIWIDDGSTAADNGTPGGFGHPVAVIGLSQLHLTVGQSDTRGEFGLVHEIGHYLFGLLDEYKDKNGSESTGATCVKPASPAIRTASIMDGGTQDSPKNQRTEFCVESNHNTGKTEQDKPRYIGTTRFENKDSWHWIQASMQDRFGVTLKIPSGAPVSNVAGFGADPVFAEGSCDLRTAVPLASSGGLFTPGALNRRELAFGAPAPILPGNAPSVLAQKGADTFSQLLDKGAPPGIVEVGKDTDSRPLFHLDLDNRYQLLDQLREINAGGRSGWADLLAGALRRLSDYRAGPGPSGPAGNEVVLLLSDGWQAPGTDESTADLLSSLKSRGVVVHAVGLANDAAAGLRKAVADTGGNYLFARTENEVNAAVMTLLAGIESRGIIEAQEGSLSPQERLDIPVPVDKATAEGQADIQLTWVGPGNGLSLELLDPNGVPVTSGEGNVNEVDSLDRKTRKIRIDRPQAGVWKVVVSSTGPAPREFAFQAHSITNGVTFGAYAEKAVVPSSTPVVLKAVVRTDQPVSGASVTAVIERPDGERRTIPLYDDGDLGHRDDRANDGVYSNAFMEYSGAGTYNVEVSVDSTGGMTVSPESRGEFVPQLVDRFLRKARLSVIVQDAPE